MTTEEATTEGAKTEEATAGEVTAEEATIGEAEFHYQQAKERLELLQVLIKPGEIISTWKRAADEMRLAGDYLDAKELAVQYDRNAVRARKVEVEKIYQKALGRLQKQVDDDAEYKLAKDSFRGLGNYKDSKERVKQCEEQIQRVAKINARKKNVALLTALLVVALGLGGMYCREKWVHWYWKNKAKAEKQTETETEELTETEETAAQEETDTEESTAQEETESEESTAQEETELEESTAQEETGTEET